jgi:DNA invertase Pin-like site-specific DNA recombinase
MTKPRKGNTNRAIALIRVSQRDEGALSPEVQRRAVVTLAGEHDWTLRAADILDENLDENGRVRNVSGSWALEDRPKLRYAIEEVEAGRAKVIIAERFDRMFRNELLRRMVVKRVEEAGGQLWSKASGEMTNQSAEGRLAHNVNGDVSEYTLQTAKERSWDAVELAIEHGHWPGPVAPLGYVKGADGVLAPDGKTIVKIVREAFERRRDGASYDEVRAFLRSRGIERTLSGTSKMLRAKVYLGEIHFGKHTPNRHAHDAIIERELFDRVQKTFVSAGRKAKSARLLARLRLVRCESCGGRMSVSGNGDGYMSYRCTGDDCAKPMTIGADLLEAEVIAVVKDAARDRKGHARAEQNARRALDEAETARAAKDAAKRRFLLLPAGEDDSEMQAIVEALSAEYERKLQHAEELVALTGPAVTVDAETVFADGTLDERRAVVRARIARIAVAPGRGAERITVELIGQQPPRDAVERAL